MESANNQVKPVKSIWGSEDYSNHWREMTIKDQRILDLGCDWGSTAEYFLKNGARAVIGVDKCADDIAYAQLHPRPNFFSFLMNIQSAVQVEYLISVFEPDIVKVDIEGAEESVFSDMHLSPLSKPKEWFVETHDTNSHERTIVALVNAGYEVKISCLDPKVISAKR